MATRTPLAHARKTFKAYATKTGDPEALETLHEMNAYQAHKAGRVEEAIARNHAQRALTM